MMLIDLSHQITEDMPTYPSDPDIQIKREKDISSNNTLLHSFKMGTHTGTHLDAPAHVVTHAKTISDFPLSSFSGKAIKVNKNNYKNLINIKSKINGVIFDFEWYKNFKNAHIFFGPNRPEIPQRFLKILTFLDLKFFGCDLPSVDASGDKKKPVHNLLMDKDIIIYESLNSLHSLPSLKPFDFFGFPLPFKNFDGSPVRAVAKI